MKGRPKMASVQQSQALSNNKYAIKKESMYVWHWGMGIVHRLDSVLETGRTSLRTKKGS